MCCISLLEISLIVCRKLYLSHGQLLTFAIIHEYVHHRRNRDRPHLLRISKPGLVTTMLRLITFRVGHVEIQEAPAAQSRSALSTTSFSSHVLP